MSTFDFDHIACPCASTWSGTLPPPPCPWHNPATTQDSYQTITVADTSLAVTYTVPDRPRSLRQLARDLRWLALWSLDEFLHEHRFPAPKRWKARLCDFVDRLARGGAA